VQVIRDEAELRGVDYDALVCLDVLEHVPHCPTHLRANRKYSGEIQRLYGAADLRPIAGRFFWTPLVLQKQTLGEPHASRSRFPLRLRLGGLLLAVGRYWPWRHCWMAIRARNRTNPRWREGLEAFLQK
jgi:hypothetical protein